MIFDEASYRYVIVSMGLFCKSVRVDDSRRHQAIVVIGNLVVARVGRIHIGQMGFLEHIIILVMGIGRAEDEFPATRLAIPATLARLDGTRPSIRIVLVFGGIDRRTCARRYSCRLCTSAPDSGGRRRLPSHPPHRVIVRCRHRPPCSSSSVCPRIGSCLSHLGGRRFAGDRAGPHRFEANRRTRSERELCWSSTIRQASGKAGRNFLANWRARPQSSLAVDTHRSSRSAWSSRSDHRSPRCMSSILPHRNRYRSSRWCYRRCLCSPADWLNRRRNFPDS